MRMRCVFARVAAGLCTLGLGLTLWAVAPAAQAAPTATYKYTLSKIAFTGPRLAIAATDSHGDLYYFWQKVGTTKWHKQLVAGGGHGQAYSKPSIVWTGSTVMIATLDASGDLVAYTQHSSTWKRKVVAKAAGHRYQAPSIAAVPGGAVLITAGKPGQLTSFEQASPGSSWTEQTVGFGNFGSPSIITAYDTLISRYLALITATSGGTLYFWWERLDVPSWHQETVATAGPGGSYACGSLAATTTKLEITAATTAGAVDTWSQSIGGSGWSEQTVATGSGGQYSHPAFTWTGPVNGGSVSYLVIAATSKTGKLAYWWQQFGLTSWNPETVATAGKHAAYANPAISVTGKSVIITAINTKPGSVYFWYQPFNTNPWHKQLVAAG